MEHFDVLLLPGVQPSDYALPLLGRSVAARMADALRQVLELTLAIKAVQKAEDMLGEAKFTLDFLKKSEERSAAAASKQE